MDQEQLFQRAKQWGPVAVAVLSSILNFLSFLIGIGFSTQYFFWTVFISLAGTMVISALLIFVLYKISTTSYPQDFTILESNDEYFINSPKDVIYLRELKIMVNKAAQFYIMFPPSAEGEQQDYRAYFKNDPGADLSISVQRVSGKKAIFVYFTNVYKKKEVIEGLCLECRLLNSFAGEYEGVNVGTDPGQNCCTIRVNLPASIPPAQGKADWSVLYGRNTVPLASGTVNCINSSSGLTIFHDFSHHLSQGIGLQCSVSWRWKPTNANQAGMNV